jgi:hypothetical protein
MRSSFWTAPSATTNGWTDVGYLRIFRGGRTESVLRNYVFCLTLVSMVAQLEYDIEKLQDIPLLKQTDKLKPRLGVLKAHFSIKDDVFWPVDLIRDARNSFVHDGQTNVNAGCSKAEMPGKIVAFLQSCKHPEYV